MKLSTNQLRSLVLKEFNKLNEVTEKEVPRMYDELIVTLKTLKPENLNSDDMSDMMSHQDDLSKLVTGLKNKWNAIQ